MSFWKRLGRGCWFRHGDLIRSRDEEGRAVLQCTVCGYEQPMFTSKVEKKGPQSKPSTVKGQAILKQVPNVVKPPKPLPANVAEFSRESQR